MMGKKENILAVQKYFKINIDNNIILISEIKNYEATQKIKITKNSIALILHSYSTEIPVFGNNSSTDDEYLQNPVYKISLLEKIEKYINNAHLHS